MTGASALARRLLADSRGRNLAFAAGFAFLAYADAAGYRSTYTTLAERLGFARTFGGNASVRLFYGRPYDLLTVGGYSAWRTGGMLSIVAAVWGCLASVRVLRGEEDSGRQEIVLAGILSRREVFASAVAAIGGGIAILWTAVFLASLAGRLAAGQSALLALAIVSCAAVFAGVGALASQLAPSRRTALEIASGVLVAALVARVAADTSSSLGWLEWATPLGWSEKVRAFTGASPEVLLLPLLAAALMLAGAAQISLTRDVGSGLLPARDSAEPRLRGLSSPAALALRSERGSLAAWVLGTAFFALVIGLVSTSVRSTEISSSLQHQLHRLAAVSITTPSGYIGLCFLFFVLAVSLFCCAQIASVRREESEQRLDTVLSMEVDRIRWLAGRLVLAAAGAGALSLGAGLGAWAGADAQGAGIPLPDMVEAGLNCLPAALLFLGLAALAFAAVPRHGLALSYSLVAIAFVWDLLGSLLGAPSWLVQATPFAHIGLAPAQPVRATAAAVMLAAALAACAAAAALFRRRDLVSG